MRISQKVKKILDNYESDNPGTKANLARILMHGKLGGTGRMVILPVDQGFEHGPVRSFAANPPAYDPHYHFQLAIDAASTDPRIIGSRALFDAVAAEQRLTATAVQTVGAKHWDGFLLARVAA